MTTHPGDIGAHPDLVELKAKYERAGQTMRAGLLEGVTLLAGLYLIISPFVVRYLDHANLAANNVIVGLALALLAFGFARSFDRTHTIAWIVPVIGIWEIVAPWLVRGTPANLAAIPRVPAALWINNVVLGIVITLAGLGIASLASARLAGSRRQR